MVVWMSKLDALLGTLDAIENPKETVAVIHAAFDETPHTVAIVEVKSDMTTTEKLEFAFMKTNSIEDAWYNNPEVTKMFDGKGCRSTSVGDMILVGKDKYKCESMGWEKI
jgi:hypothetical protein